MDLSVYALKCPNVRHTECKPGRKVRVTVEGNPNVYEGQVMRIGPTISEQNRMLTVEADVRNRDFILRPGSFANVDIVTNEADMAITVPTSAVVTFAGLEKVLVVNEAKRWKRRFPQDSGQ